MKPKRAVLVDFRSQVYRALYAPGPRLTSPSGEPTHGSYYYTRILLQTINLLEPTHLLVADDSRASWRRDEFPGYKSGRRKDGDRDEDELRTLKITMKRCEQITRALGMSFVRVRGFEADDLIASFVHKYEHRVDEIIIVSRDKDLHQCVSDTTWCYDPHDRSSMGLADVIERWGVDSPALVRDVQALAGDPTDNIPGLRGVGVKTAAKWVREYGDAYAVMENAEDLPERIQLGMAAFDLELSFLLVTLRTDVNLRRKLRDCRFRKPDIGAASSLFDELGFSSFG